jgi:uncharacterized DUF497 family protein
VVYADHVDWDEPDDPRGNVQHIARNGITVEEFEEILFSPDSEEDVSRSSDRPARYGRTSTGRLVFIVYEVEESPEFTVIRPVTAYAPEEDR